jgi:hypothetical protein
MGSADTIYPREDGVWGRLYSTPAIARPSPPSLDRLADLQFDVHAPWVSPAARRMTHSRDQADLGSGVAVVLRGASWFFLAGLEVQRPDAATVVAFGDSITDGFRR